MSDAGERNQEPTPLRLQQARAEGNIPKSGELAAALSMLGAIAAAYLTFAQVARWLQTSTTGLWAAQSNNQFSESIIASVQTWLFGLAGVLLPFMATLMFVSMAANWIQTGPIWLPNKAKIDLGNLGPGKLRQQLSLSSLLSILSTGIPKIALGLAVMAWGTWYQRETLFSLANAPADMLVNGLFGVVLTVCLQVAAVLTVLGVIDYGIQWLGHRRRMRMSHEEIREEHRRQGGADSVNRLRRRQGL